MQIERKQLKKPIAILVVILGLLGLLFIWQYIRQEMAQQFSQHAANPVTSVEVGYITTETWHPQVSAIGTIRAIQGTNISSEITGKISKIFFVSGQMVKQGDPLIQLDNSSLEADVEQARASYLAAELHFRRIAAVYRQRAISKEDYDQANASLQEDKAALAKAVTLLNQATITAPFAGKLGLRYVSLGQYVAAGDAMVSLQQLDPLYVDFDLSEAFISLVHVGDKIQLTTATYPGKVFAGYIIATNSILNSATRTLNVRAEVANPAYELVPGMFAEVNVSIPQQEQVLTVPEMAINYSPFGDAIFKIVNNKAQQVYVKVGEQRGNRVAITGNIKANDSIVTVGVFKLQNGSAVKIVQPPKVGLDKRPGTMPTQKIHRESAVIPQSIAEKASQVPVSEGQETADKKTLPVTNGMKRNNE